MTTIGMAAATSVAHAQGTNTTSNGTSPPSPTNESGSEIFKAGTFGLTFPLTLNVIQSPVAVPTVSLTYFLTDSFALQLIAGIGIRHFEEPDPANPAVMIEDTVVGSAAAVGGKIYIHHGELHMFIEPAVLYSWVDASNTATIQLRFSGSFGVEREITDWFTFSGTMGGVLAFDNKFENIEFAPVTNLFANFYWR